MRRLKAAGATVALAMALVVAAPGAAFSATDSAPEPQPRGDMTLCSTFPWLPWCK